MRTALYSLPCISKVCACYEAVRVFAQTATPPTVINFVESLRGEWLEP